MKKVILLFLILFCNESFSQNGWYQLQSGTTYSLRDAYFINELTGWAICDSGWISVTTSGGLSWSMQRIGTNPYPGLYSINFANNSTGYIGGGLCFSGYTGISYLYKTTNQGLNWSFVYSGFGGDYIYWISSISIINPETIFTTSCGGYSLGGSVGNIAKSTNGGLNFSTGYSVGSHKSSSFINEQTGWTIANYADDIGKIGSYILKTINSGNNWSFQFKDTIKTINFSKIKFFNENTGYALGVCNQPIRSLFFKTTNGGVNWDTTVIQNSNTYSMFFIDVNTGWICGNFYGDTSCIIKTTNSGLTWVSQKKGFSGVSNIFMVNSNLGYAVGSGGLVLKTITGGNTIPSDTESVKYFPMHVGNVYTYSWQDGIISVSSGYFKARILRDSVFNGFRYFYISNFPDLGTRWVRYDSLRSNLLAYSPNANCSGYSNDKIIDSLKMSPNNQITSCVQNWSLLRCDDTSTTTIFSNQVSTKMFRHDGLQLAHTRYAKNFGIIAFDEGEPPPSTYFVGLAGCKINGVTYGDTNIYYKITGNVKYSDNNQPVTIGIVKAFKLNKASGNVIILDTAVIQSDGSYTLPHVPQDSVDIGVFPNSTPPSDYIVTYYPSTIYWQSATVIYPTGNMTNVNISAIRMFGENANNSISGMVMRNMDGTTGNLKDAFLYAKSGNTFVRCTISNVSGIYNLQSLPSGNLKIIVTRLGYSSDSVSVNMTSTANIDSINFYLYRIYSGIKNISNAVPSEYKLFQNYPNPFNPSTNIRFRIMKNNFVSLKVYDLLGREISLLVNEKLSPGEYEIQFSLNRLPSGIYFYRLEAGDFIDTKKMVLLK